MLKWFVLELFLNKPFYGTALEKILMLALEQAMRIFLKLSYSHYKYLLEKYWDTYRILYVTFFFFFFFFLGGGGGVMWEVF